MVAQRTLLQIPLYVGLNTSIDDKALDVGSLSAVENATITKQGVISKRYGFATGSALTTSGTQLTDINHITSLGSELLVATNSALYGYLSGTDRWLSRGAMMPLDARTTRYDLRGINLVDVDFCIANNYMFIVGSDTRGGADSYGLCVDLRNNAVVIPKTLLNSAAPQWRVHTTSTGYVYFLGVTNAGFLSTTVLNTNNSFTSFPTSGTVLASGVTPTCKIGSWVDNENKLIVGYRKTATGYLYAINVDFTGSVSAELATTTAVNTAEGIALNCNTWGTLICFNPGGGQDTWGWGIDNTWTSAGAPASIGTSAGERNWAIWQHESIDNAFRIACDLDNANTRAVRLFYYDPSTGLGAATSLVANCHALAAQPFRVNGTTLFPTYYTAGNISGSSTQPTLLLSDNTGVPYARILPAEALFEETIMQNSYPVPGKTVITGSKAYFAAVTTYNDNYLVYDSYVACPTIVEIDLSSSYVSQTVNETKIIAAGAQVYEYDGERVYEHNFTTYPEIFNTFGSSTGGTLSDGTYTLQACWTWYNKNNDVIRSAFSPSRTVYLSGGTSTQKITYKTANQYVTSKDLSSTKNSVRLDVYCTEKNGSLPYFADYQKIAIGSTENLCTGSISTITTTNPFPYTIGGELENTSLSNVCGLAASDTRLFAKSTQGQIYYSKPLEYGKGPEFNEFEAYVDGPKIGRYGLLETIGERVYEFSDTGIKYFYGEGPDRTGQNGSYSSLIMLSNEHRLSAKWTCKTDAGIYFPTDKGLMLLGNDQSFTDVSARIQSTWESYTTTSCVLIDDELFISTTSGDILVYNIRYGVWSITTAGIKAVSTTALNDVWYLATTGSLHYSTAQFADTGSFYSLKVKTPWIKLAGLQSYQEVNGVTVLGEYRSPHQLNMNVYTNYDETPVETITWSCHTGSVGSVLQREAILGHHCQSIRFELWDSDQQGTGESLKLNSLQLDVALINERYPEIAKN